MKKVKRKPKSHVQNQPDTRNARLPFIEHLYELRKRLMFIALSVGAWSTAAYFVQQHIVALLLKPAHSQQFIYTSVGGGIDFLFRICIYTGIVCSIPVIIFQILKYLEPLIKKDAMRFMLWGSAVSGVLAVAGIAFGYYVGLPSALHFLLHQFTTDQIHPLLTIQSYMSFVTLYMLGSALLFQGPLLLVLINRVKPLKPSKLLGVERWVILIAFVLGGIMNPSPRWQDQLLLAGPMIGAYQIGIMLVWLANRGQRRPARIVSLREKDNAARAERLAKFQQAQAAYQPRQAAAATPTTTIAPLGAGLAPAAPRKPKAPLTIPVPVRSVAHARPAAPPRPHPPHYAARRDARASMPAQPTPARQIAIEA